MKSMIVAAVAAFMLTGAASAGVPTAKPVVAKGIAEATPVHVKPGSSRGGGGPGISICSPFGCRTLGSGWGK